MDKLRREYIGRGWRFPIGVSPHGGLSFSAGEQRVEESIWIILSTARGSRQMLPSFGCGIHDYVFSPNEPSMHGQIAHQVREALTTWEPRIDVLGVQVGEGSAENQLLIRIDYRIRSNNAVFNLVYPFYLQEGAGT